MADSPENVESNRRPRLKKGFGPLAIGILAGFALALLMRWIEGNG